MELHVIRNKRQLLMLCEMLEKRRLPLKVAVEDIYPIRSLDLNAYYWGVVLKYISDASGHDVIECHEGYKKRFSPDIRFDLSQDKGIYEPVFDIGSTADMNVRVFADYIFHVRVDGELEHHIIIPLPSEAFVPELDFDHDKIENHAD